MYGPNAAAGVINIITKKPANAKDGFSAGTFTQAGNFGTIISSTSFGYKMNNGFSVKATGNIDMRQRHWSDYYVFSKKQYTLTKPYPNNYYTINDFIENLNNSVANMTGSLVRDPDKPSNSPLNMKDRFPDEELALDKMGGNVHFNYNKNGMDINFMGGYAQADAQKVWANNRITAITSDKYDEMGGHIWGTYKGLSISGDYSLGTLQILGSGKTLAADWNIMNANAEYDFHILNNSLDIKPGISYRGSSFYGLSLGSTKINTSDPTNYVVEEDEGDITNSAISPFLRTEYRYKKLRLIGAIRADMFAAPKLTQISPLFAATYKVSDDFLIRGSYGKAARTPMAQDLFMKIDLGPYPLPTSMLPPNAKHGYQSIHYRGTERPNDLPNFDEIDYKLLTIEAVELGFRHKVTQNFTIDFDLFGSRLNNLVTNFTIDSKTEYNSDDSVLHLHYYPSYINLDAQPYQIGATVAITSMPFEKMLFQIFFTAQETEMTKYYDALDAKGQAVDGTDADESKYKSWFHAATPSFFGGINLNYEVTKKINYNINAYFYSRQTLTINVTNTREVRPNVILNTNVSYEIVKGVKVFGNVRNLAGSGIRQYAFGDKISWMALGGVNINL